MMKCFLMIMIRELRPAALKVNHFLSEQVFFRRMLLQCYRISELEFDLTFNISLLSVLSGDVYPKQGSCDNDHRAA